MGMFFGRRIHKSVAAGDVVDVSERDGVRSLHLGSQTVQSSMRISAPNELELAYTRSMMGFLLFNPDPVRFLMVGLGGGSLAKFVYHHMPTTRIAAVELNSQVAAAARAYFHLPPEDERFEVVIAEGGQYVAEHPDSADVLMVDGFDGVSLADALVTQRYYDDSSAALSERGVLAVNLWGGDKNFDIYLQRIETSFNGLTLCLPTEKYGNMVVFGFKRSPGNPRWDDLRQRARKLEQAYGLEFLKFVEGLRSLNAHTEKRLLI
ncbi:MAG: spermidine synthase [Hydrogenophilales bacterium CG_4_9_14_3_um_filter_59_35]|nr:MAG: spermidine synthase [Hydrogenophilales bacterium CG18_big_fil_WC_8_21_14_2_50_58_12]PIY00641.1 MAG: spermidine synthase [Hydrogenophilales bacterium CG_4_10_14_3_um_filter_58_23]PJB07078.1 MAG: spermidine synthase [Hydrogenophilales bacterium CG_4_9_14_3_um_filter_59_35]